MYDYFVRSEKYILGIMIVLMGILAIYLIWDGIDSWKKMENILTEHLTSQEESLEFMTLKITSFQPENEGSRISYVTFPGVLHSFDDGKRFDEFTHSDSKTVLTGMEYSPSFPVKNEHKSFWSSQLSWYLVLEYGGLVLFCILSAAFGYTNLKQEDKLLTKQIQKIIEVAFFLCLFGYLGFQFLNDRTITFLNSEFKMDEPLPSLNTTEVGWLVLALLLAYVLISKAVPVQQDQDLTV